MPRWQGADDILRVIREENIKTLELIVFQPIEEVVRQAEERAINEMNTTMKEQ